MRDAPSPELVELLTGLRLVTTRQLAAAAGRARRLAGALPAFDSVWLDALVQTRCITPFQANAIQNGRGPELACGPYRARDRCPTLGYAQLVASEEALLAIASVEPNRHAHVVERLSAIAARTEGQTSGYFLKLLDHGLDGNRLWTAWERPEGMSAAHWMTAHGRLPPQVVLEIARRMLVGLCELERHGEVHGDLHVRSLFLSHRGELRMGFAGLRNVVLGQESFEGGELPPYCYETVARERIGQAAPPNQRSELFACGCVWWHLLTGHPAIAGGNSAAKLQNAATGNAIPEVRQYAPDAPEILAELIAACTAIEPAHRPRSFAEMARILGPPAEQGARTIATALHKAERWVLPRPRRKPKRDRLLQPLSEAGAVAVCLLLVLLVWRWGVPAVSTHRAFAKAHRIPLAAPVTSVPPETTTASVISQVTFEQPETTPPHLTTPAPLRLPEGRVIRLASLNPVAGQRICGENDGRVQVSLSAEGLTINVDGVRFENIDFHAPIEAAASSALLHLRAATATFSGCRFFGNRETESLAIGIDWQSTAADDWLPTDECLKFDSCAFHCLDAAITKHHPRAAAIEFTNGLQTRSGCLVRCSLSADAKPLRLELERCTLRDTGSVICVTEIAEDDRRSGRVRVAAVDSVFQLNAGRALMEFPVDFDTAQLAQVQWMGSGSLCGLQAPLAAVTDRAEQVEVIDETQLEITGLARSPLEFTGKDLDTAAASELRRWAAARRSKLPPGITATETSSAEDHSGF